MRSSRLINLTKLRKRLTYSILIYRLSLPQIPLCHLTIARYCFDNKTKLDFEINTK